MREPLTATQVLSCITEVVYGEVPGVPCTVPTVKERLMALELLSKLQDVKHVPPKTVVIVDDVAEAQRLAAVKGTVE